MKSDDAFFLATAFISAAIGLSLGLGIKEASSWYEFAKDWETLLAGILALIAAYITVGQMRSTDKEQASRFLVSEQRQQERHRALLDLNLRGDILKTERAAQQAELFPEICEAAPEWTPPKSRDRETIRKAADEFIRDVEFWADRSDRDLNAKVISDASDLFSAALYRNRDDMLERRRALAEAIQQGDIFHQDTDRQYGSGEDVKLLMDQCQRIGDCVIDFCGEIRAFGDRLFELHLKYAKDRVT